MTDKERLVELAERVEAAPGPDRAVDALIYVSLFKMPYNREIPAPAYTASLDAALTLVPEGCSWRAGLANYGGFARIDAIELSEDYQRAATPALALTAAALRARASEAE